MILIQVQRNIGKLTGAGVIALVLAACSPSISNAVGNLSQSAISAIAKATDANSSRVLELGVRQDAPYELSWSDLIPVASADALAAERAEFLAQIQAQYAPADRSTTSEEYITQIGEGSSRDFMPQLGDFETVSKFDDQYVRIPGYIVPLDLNSKFRQREFLFVPHQGACIHTPPPPPNQIILIQSNKPFLIRDIWRPYWVEGTLRSKSSENAMGDAAYQLDISAIEQYFGTYVATDATLPEADQTEAL